MAGSTLRKDLVFPVAGHFLFVPYGINGLPDMTKAYNSNKGVVVSIQRAMTLNTTQLPDGNSPYPAAEYVTTQEGTITYVLSTYDPQLEALVAGATFEDGTSTDGEMWTIASETVPSAAEYKLTLDPRPKSKDQIVIEDMYGNKFEHEDTAPSAGSKFTYDSSGGTITFNVADAGKAINIVYCYDGTAVTSVSYLENPKKATFMAITIGQTKDKDEVTFQNVNVIVDRCTVSGAVTPPTASNDPTQGWTLTTSVLKPRAGKNPVKVKFENVTE